MHFILVAISMMALIRYRSMVPLIYLILIYEYLSRRLLSTIWMDTPFLQLATSTAGAIVQSLLTSSASGALTGSTEIAGFDEHRRTSEPQ